MSFKEQYSGKFNLLLQNARLPKVCQMDLTHWARPNIVDWAWLNKDF